MLGKWYRNEAQIQKSEDFGGTRWHRVECRAIAEKGGEQERFSNE
jgi:hypothetical protein